MWLNNVISLGYLEQLFNGPSDPSLSLTGTVWAGSIGDCDGACQLKAIVALVMKKIKKPYSDRTDIEKLESNWTKTLGLLERREYSMAIIRSATCAEIAANIVVRAELVEKRGLDLKFVDSLLLWANGLNGKFSKIILPLLEGTPQHAKLSKYRAQIATLNKARNEIAHSGRFASPKKAKDILHITRLVCSGFISRYHPAFKFRKI